MMAVIKAFFAGVPWRAVGIFGLAVAGLVLWLRAEHFKGQAAQERENAAGWERAADSVLEISNENARAALAAIEQAKAADARADEADKKRATAERAAAKLKERVANASQGLASPGVRAAISGLPE